MPARIEFDHDKIATFCRNWKVQELALFGSVLRDDFRRDSDIDVLVTFRPDSPASYWDWDEMIGELEVIFGRRVDLVPSGGVRNPFRRQAILGTREVIHAA